jgi:NADPH:quinone reductase-like Zn-dependent oxidoreductase
LTRSGVRDGDKVLVTGASGGVGSAVVQLARLRGATVIALVGKKKADKLLALGAARVEDRDANLVERLGANSIDVVIDLVGGSRWPMLIDILRHGGRYASSGAIAGAVVSLDLRSFYFKDLTLYGCTSFGAEVFNALIGHIESGYVAPLVAETYPLREIVAAQKAFLAKKHVGKIVLTVAESN